MENEQDLQTDETGRPRSINGRVNLLLNLVEGNPYDRQDKGMIGDVRECKNRLNKLENWRRTTMAWVAGVSFGGGAFLAFVLKTLLK